MSSYLGSHGGAAPEFMDISDVDAEVAPDEQFDNAAHLSPRKYLLLVADPANPGPVYLSLSAGPAMAGAGIMLPPGAGFEINFINLYQGPLHAISTTGLTNRIYIQRGY